MNTTVCAIYMDLENLLPYKNINIKSIMDEIVLKNHSDNQSETIFAIKLACGNKDSIEHFVGKLSEYNFDIRNVYKITANYKNRADLIISMEAFETLITNSPKIDKYIFLSSDSDFTIIMEKLRKHGKQVWLITNSEASKKPIFNNTCNEIYTFDKFIDEKNEEDNIENDKNKVQKMNVPQEDNSYSENDNRAILAFKKIIESLVIGKICFNSTVGGKFHQIEKSLDFKDTSFKTLPNILKYFEKEDVIEIGTSEKGHPYIKRK